MRAGRFAFSSGVNLHEEGNKEEDEGGRNGGKIKEEEMEGGPGRKRWREDQGGREERGLYLSGSNFSGSVQKFGSWWMR